MNPLAKEAKRIARVAFVYSAIVAVIGFAIGFVTVLALESLLK